MPKTLIFTALALGLRPSNINTHSVIRQAHLNVLVCLTAQGLKATATLTGLGLKTNPLYANQCIDC